MAFNQLALRCHPDKGGDAYEFTCLRFVCDVLRNAAKRVLYDERGRAAFANEFPKKAEGEPDDSDGAMEQEDDVAHDPDDDLVNDYVYHQCPVSKQSIMHWVDRLPMRELRQYGTFAEMIYAQVQRAKRVDGKFLVLDRFAEAKRPRELGLRGSLEIAPDSDAKDPRLACDADVNGVYRGLSAFAFPRLCRYIVRAGLDTKLIQEDIVNSQLRMIFEHLTQAERDRFGSFSQAVRSREQTLMYLLVALNTTANVDDKDALRAELLKYSEGVGDTSRYTRDDCKTLLLALTYGASLPKAMAERPSRVGGIPKFLLGFAKDVRGIAKIFADRFPDVVRKCAEWKKPQPEMSTLSYLAAHWQRETVEKMQRGIGEGNTIVSEERDGHVIWIKGEAPTDTSGLTPLQGAAPVTFEKYLGQDDLEAFARAKYPYHDWSARSVVKMKDYVRSLSACRKALDAVENEDASGASNITDFGTVIAFLLEPFVYVSDSDQFEYFDVDGTLFGVWNTTKKERALKKLVRRELLNLFRKQSVRVSYCGTEKVVERKFLSAPRIQCKKSGFRNAVAEDASLLLLRQPQRPLDDDNNTRHLLQDADGRVYDYERRRFVTGVAALRLCHRLPWKFGDAPESLWSAPPVVKAELRVILQEIFAFWLSGDGPLHKTLDDEPVFGRVLADKFRKFVMEKEFCKYWHALMPIYNMNVDESLWKTLHRSADCCAWAKRCEFIYEFGKGNTGKDTNHTISQAFFGEKAKGCFGATIPPSWFTSKHEPNPEAPSAILESFRSARYLANNEIPLHKWFNADAAKPMCEQEGTRMISRGLYKDPETWRAMGGVYLTSNYPIVLSEDQCEDTGTRRRLNVGELTHVFTKNDSKEMKELINTKALNAEVFWLSCVFREYLEQMPPKSDFGARLLPIPPRIHRETDAVLSRKAMQHLREYVETNTAPSTFANATAIAELRKVLETVLKLPDGAYKTIFEQAGVRPRASGRFRVYAYQYADCGRMQPIKLNDGIYEQMFPEDPEGPAETGEATCEDEPVM